MAMDRPPNLTAGIFLLLLAVYHASAQCKFSCSGASGSVKLEPGKSYHYDLSGTTVTTKPGANGDVSKLSLNAKVEIIAGAHCDHVISLSNVHTSGPDGKKHSLDKTLGNRHTKFGLDGGKLEKLCVDPEESQPSINIKRAAISLLQVALSKGSGEVVETDVFGVCPTSIDLSKSGNTLHVVKTRNLNRCALREGLNLPVAAPSYYNPSDIQGYSLLSGELKVNQKIENGVVKSAEAQEHYEYNPTASLDAGTKISVTTKLSLSGVSPKPLPPAVKCTTEKTLVFDTEHESEFRGTAAEITSLIKKVTESGVVNAEDARHFTSLVNAISIAPKAEILSVFHAIQSGSVSNDKDSAKKLLLDALYSSLSASSVEAIADLIKSKDIAGEHLNFWYMRMGNVKHASRASLTSALSLLGGSPSDAAYLGLGQLGGRFCAEHNCNFFGLNEVNAFQKKLGEPLLKKGCIPKNHKDEDQLIASIKGLGNMKFLTKDVSVKLAACFTNKAVKSRIRSAVADTMSTDPHKSSIKDAAIKVFIDPKEDSELRIKAYLVLVKCPCGAVAQHVTDVLESQKSYQVGSFIVSHLKNLKASTNPDKADAQRHLNSVVTSKKYKHDQRKYSQNYELSYSLDVLNMGAASEANVIYSQKSWMPRYVSLNLTSQLYGHAYNLLEVGARLDNVEKIVENLVGPKGYLRTHSANDVIDKTKSYANGIWEKIMTKSDKAFRPKRSPTTWSELSALANKVNLGLDSDHDVNIDLSLKSFGAEIGWLKLHEAEGKIKPDKIINDAFGKLDEVINEAKDFDKDYRKNIVFSNVEVTYPTSLGLALRLKSLGTGSVRVKVDGKIDVPAILKNPQNADLKLQLIPSAALELRGDLSVDGIAVETGVRVALNVHSSTATTLTFRVLDGHGVDVKVGLPVNKQEIISVKTHINTVVKEDGKPETLSPVSFDTKKESYQGCFDQATFLIGLTFCGKVSTPWDGPRSISPAYGPSELSLEVVKDDESLNTYHLRFYQQIHDGKANIEFLFDTPESSADRKISVVFDGELKPKKFLKVNLHTPWLGASVDGSVVDTDNELSANAKLNLDDAEYLIKLGAKKTKNGNELKLEPIFEYKSKGLSSEAILGRRPGTKSVSNQQTTTVSGVILVDLHENPHSRKWKIQGLSLNTPQMTFVLDGTGKCDDKGVEIDNVLKYGEDSVAIKGHALHEGPKRSLHIGVSPSQNKDASVDILFTTHKTGDIGSKLDYENKLVITHGVDPNAETPRISFINKVNKDTKASSLSLSTKVTYPLVQLDGQASLSIKPNTLAIGVQGNFDTYSGGFQINGDVDAKKIGEYNVGLSGNLMKNSISISSSRKILKAHQSKFVNTLDLKPGGHYTLTSTVTHDFNGKNLDLQVDAVAKFPVEPKTLNIKAGLKKDKSENKGHLKATAGDKTYVDIEGHVKKSDKPSGGFKVKLPTHIDTVGDFTFDGNNLVAKAELHLPKINKKAEAKADLKINNQKVAGNVDICWDTANPSKSLKIQTDTSKIDGDQKGFTSKNSLQYENKKTSLNAKYLVSIKNGKLADKGSSSGEFELEIPNGLKIGGKSSGVWDVPAKQGERFYQLSMNEPNKTPKELKLKIVGKNFDHQPLQFDSQVTLTYAEGDKDATLHYIVKKVPKDGEKWTVKGEFGSSGSLVKKPLTVSLISELSEKILEGKLLDGNKGIPPMNYKFTLSQGSAITVESTGKLSGTTLAGELAAQIPEGKTVKSLKYVTSNVIDILPSTTHKKLKTSQHLQWDGDNFWKVEAEGNQEDDGIKYSLECESSTLQKRQISGTAHVNRHEGLKADLTSTLAWEGKTADFSAKFDSNKDNSIVGAHIASNFPDKKIDLLLKNKLTKEGRGIHTDVTLSHDNKKLSASSKIELDKDHPLLDVNIDHPEGGQSKLMLKADHKGHHHWSSALKAKWSNNGGTLSVENDANLGELDNLSIKSNVELPEHKKMSLDVNVKDGKKLSFTATKDEKPWISGNANYEKKIEGQKKIVTGKGNVEIDGKSYPLKYDGVYEKLEEGNKMNVEVEVGSRKVSINAVKTPAEFSVERKYCKEDGKCSSAHFKNQIKKITKHNYEHNIDYQLDLSTLLGPKYHDLSFKSHFERNDLKMDHKVNAQWSDNGKISYDACVNEEKSGVTLVLPKRTVGGEIHYNIGKGEKVGNSKIGVDLWLNKEKNDILSLVASSDVSRNNDGGTVSAQIHLHHPSLKKDLIVKGKATVNSQMNKVDAEGIVDVFKNANQKIVATYKGSRNIQDKNVHVHYAATLKSEGCKMDESASWELKYNHQEKSIKTNAVYTWAESNGAKNKLSYDVEGTPAKLIGNVHLPDGTTGKLDSKVQWENKVLNWPISANVGDLKYHNHLVVDLNENHLKNTAGCGGKTILLEAGVKIGKTGVLKLALDNKAATELNVALDETNFLKTKYNYDVDTLKAIWHTIANSLSTTIKTLDQKVIKVYSKSTKICQAVLECLKDSAPDLTQAIDHVKGELKLIKEELQADQALNKLVHFIKVHLGKYGEQLETILEELAKFAKTINSLVKQSADKGYELYKTIAPKVQESVESISNIIVEVSERVLQLSIKIVDAVLDELKKHEKDIQEYVDAAIEFVHDFGKQFFQTALSIQEELKKFCDSAIESVKELPILAMIQEKLDEAKTWAVPEEVISVYSEIAEVVISIMPTPECEDFIATASGYLVKLMNKEDFDKKEAAKQLSTKGEAALRSLVKKLAEFVPNQPTWKPNQWFQLPIVKVLRAPNGGVRLSAINWVVANGVPNAYQLLATYKPNLAKPLDNIPPFKGVGAIIGGNQILTFDGRHIDTSGSCSYVLAQDFVDKNFSVSAKFSGKWYLDSITIADPKNSITVVHKGQSSLNGAPTDFPLIAGDLGAFWTPFGYIIKSKAGVKITCDKLLANCFVTVSGFYFNKVRGLLGNLNYEPEDDWSTPSGEVASDVSAFTSAWKTNPGCAAASGQSHSEPRQELCTELFGKNPEILIGKPWANIEPWRAICDHGVNSAPADMKKKVACIIARDYVYYARKKGAFFLRLPLTCIECELENGESVENLSFEELKTDKAADIIFVVEATDDNKDTFNDLVNPLIAQLKTELAKKEISDVKVYILSFSPNHWHAVGHTSNGEGSYDGKHINMHWSPRSVDNEATIEDKVRLLLKKIGLETGTTPLSHAYEQVIKYNAFRPHALKAVIGVHGKPCHSPLNVVVPTKAILSILYSAYRGTTYHVITPVKNLQVEGFNTDEVVGFNLDHALTLDGKVHKANAEHDLDYCVESAEVSGSVFSVDNFKKAQSAGKGAQFVQTAAHSLAATIAENAKDTVDCHCSLVDGLFTRVSCHKHDFLESEEEDD